MPDYPYVYPEGAVRPIQPGATRLRFFRRRPRSEGEAEPHAAETPETAWGELLEAAIRDINAAFRQAGAPYTCVLEEDAAGFLLKVIHESGEPLRKGTAEVDEVLEPADLPAWLARLRAHLGILVDERV
ncbi:MAG: hypothetical protein HZB55_10785 [Deltaproteobacteria bacterium]|nr:hypothetical protein [Deltaproteobacteria bacterium]